MNLIQESYQRLFPEKECPYQTRLEYNRRLADFNARIKLHFNILSVNLNLQWKDIDQEIKIGLIQHLLLKILKKKKNTPEIELYHQFIRNIPLFAEKNKFDPLLEKSFQRVNDLFFNSELEKPNLVWGKDSLRKLACYNFHRDTITVSTIFKEARSEILDYVMYHELLHKFHQFTHQNGRSYFHHQEFKKNEKKYPHYPELETEINQLIRKHKKARASVRFKKKFLFFA